MAHTFTTFHSMPIGTPSQHADWNLPYIYIYIYILYIYIYIYLFIYLFNCFIQELCVYYIYIYTY